jgi:putative SOS response-associated peptidase YedK
MAVILSLDYFDEWLSAKPEQSARFLIPYPADQLTVSTSASLD